MADTNTRNKMISSFSLSLSMVPVEGTANVPQQDSLRTRTVPEAIAVMLGNLLHAQLLPSPMPTFTGAIGSYVYDLTIRYLSTRNCWELQISLSNHVYNSLPSMTPRDETFGAHSARLFREVFAACKVAATGNSIEAVRRITTESCEKLWQASLFMETQNGVATVLGIQFPEQVYEVRLTDIIKHNWSKELRVLIALCTTAEERLRESGVPCAREMDILMNLGEHHSYAVVKLDKGADNPLAVVMRELKQEGLVSALDYAVVSLKDEPEDQNVRFITLATM